jgi:hypothetical protein
MTTLDNLFQIEPELSFELSLNGYRNHRDWNNSKRELQK